MSRFPSAVLLLLLLSSNVLAADLPKPVYDESADAKKDIASAISTASQENKRVLLLIGGNWCHWCTLLHDLFQQNENVHSLLNSEYEVVNIDIAHGEKNADLLQSYGIHPQGYPYLAILDSNNTLVTQQETGALENGPAHDPSKVIAFLTQWKPAPQDAKQVLATALTQAATQNKRVFLRFGAPWCGWCHKLDDILRQPAVSDALSSEFITIKIDTERMTSAPEVQAKYQTSPGIPWFAILSPDGSVQSKSELAGSNYGFPTEPPEIDKTITMLTDHRIRMTDTQVAALRTAFTTAAAVVKAAGH